MRLHLTLAIIVGILLIVTLRAHRKPHFTFANVDKIAAQRALEKYEPLPYALPPPLRNLTPEQEAGIFFKDAYRLWRKKGLPFQVDLYHISKMFPTGPRIFTVDAKGTIPLAYSPVFFEFRGLNPPPALPQMLPYAGFYLRYPIPTATETHPDVLNGFFSVLGTNYFRVLAEQQVYGLSARALSINTGNEKENEEFPVFTDWWLHEPNPDDTEVTLDAVLDSPSVTGAYEFKIRPGAVTSVEVHAVLHFRQAVAQLGLTPFSSMYLYGENAGNTPAGGPSAAFYQKLKNHFGDTAHPEIHDSDGVMVHTSQDTWMWRPLQQTPFMQQYDFPDQNPKGYGLIQRDRDFSHYEDLDALYNVRPSVWVTPHGDWGKGSVHLTQLPTDNTNTDNVVLFWEPAAQPKAGDRMEIDYTIDFYMNDATKPPLAYVKQTLVNDPAPPPTVPPSISPGSPPALASGSGAKPAIKPPPPAPAPPKKTGLFATTPVQFIVDFAGNGIENVPGNMPPDLDFAATPPETGFSDSRVEKNAFDNSWRVTFTVSPYKHFVPTEMHCRLFPHSTVKRVEDELTQLHNQIDQAEKKNDHVTADNLTKHALPQKQTALQDLLSRPLTETWTYTWHQ